jgi:hypothetical protein
MGYNSITDIKKEIKMELASQLDSTRKALDSIERRQKVADSKLTYSDSVISIAQNAIFGLITREKYLNGSLSLRSSDLTKLKDRIAEINSKNIIQQSIYIIDNLEYTFNVYWEFKKYYYKDLLTNTGQRLPNFKKQPFILAVSNEGFTFSIIDVTAESFDLIASNNSSNRNNDLTKMKVTLFIIEKT